MFLCGIIFSAIKSTADSQLLVASSSVVGDIYKGLIHKNASVKHLVWVSRLSIFALAAIGLFFARTPGGGVMALVPNAWAGFGAAFGPLVILSLFWKRIDRAGALAGMIVGGLTVIIWEYVPVVLYNADRVHLGHSQATGLYSLVPGFFLSIVTIIITSLLTAPPTKEIIDGFELSTKPIPE